MKAFQSEKLIDELVAITTDGIRRVESKLMRLAPNQTNWSKNPNVWNINQVFAHLNEYANFYHPTFQDKIAKTKFKDAKEMFISSPLGRSAWRSMKLGNAKNIKRKFNSPKGYNPTHDTHLVTGNDVSTFLEGQKNFLSILESARNVNLKKVRVPISISKIVRLRLGDALMFITYHNERHVQQAFNILNDKSFPKKK